MTKVIILGGLPIKEERPIKFILHCVNRNGFTHTDFKPSTFETVELISKDFCTAEDDVYVKYDLMFAYNKDNRSMGHLFLGHFNDGFVELS